MIVRNVSSFDLMFDKLNQSTTQAVTSLAVSNYSVEVNRLLVAAVVNRRFCRLLLGNPAGALAAGYRGQPFKLTAAERSCILAIYATSLQDFARQLAAAMAPEMTPALVPLLPRYRVPVPENNGQSSEA